MSQRNRPGIKPISATRHLEDFCGRASRFPYVAVDTEFVGEGHYFPQLCLVQLAIPDGGADSAVAVDPLSPQLRLDPLRGLLADRSVLKVFHSARQDLAIFHHLFGSLPEPVFDTQLAAMVCGYGQSVGYGALVADLTGRKVDKSARLLDWSRRPLPQRLLRYALGDVIHLRSVYEKLSARMAELNRGHWIQEELDILADVGTYRSDPRDAWKKIKKLKGNGQYLSVLRELAAFREECARARDRPKNRILSDDALVHLAETRPLNQRQLSELRMPMGGGKRSELADGIINAVKAGMETPKRDWPKLDRKPAQAMNGAAFELLRVLLRVRAQELGVAEQIIATTDDLRRLASGDADARQLSGWRREVFGNDAMRINDGRLAIAVDGEKLRLVASRA